MSSRLRQTENAINYIDAAILKSQEECLLQDLL